MIHEWWFDGEVNASAVYRQSYRQFIISLVISVAFALLIQAVRVPYLFVAIVLAPVAGLVQRRRAIIFTDGALLYRPAFAKPTRVILADVVSVEPCKIRVYKGGKFANLVEAIRFHLKTGEEVKVPLDFPESKLIKERLLSLDQFTRSPGFGEPQSTPR